MGVEFYDYIKGDAASMQMREGDMLGYAMSEYTKPAWSMLLDDEVVACCGLVFAAEGIYNLWAIVSDKARGHGLAMTKFLNARLDEAYDVLNIHRIQALARADRPEYCRYLEMFGFELEGVAKQGTPDRTDIKMYGRVL